MTTVSDTPFPAIPAVAIPAPTASPPAPAPGPNNGDERFVIPSVDWKTYSAIMDALGDRPLRATYDGSSLEFFMPGPDHEYWKDLLLQLIIALGEEFDLDVDTRGSTTFRRREAERALEADTWFWIAHAPEVIGKQKLDLVKHPPDLAIEIESSRSALDRMDIYARLGIAEVWRYDGAALTVHVLKRGKTPGYRVAKESPSFPGFPVGGLADFLKPERIGPRRKWLAEFRAWVRKSAGLE